MKLYTPILLCLISYVQTAFGNVEKTIFVASNALAIPSDGPTLANLQLQSLSPANSTVRTQLQARFPSDDSPDGVTSWFILEQLSEGQRYEVRVCWAATNPTSFRLKAYEISDVFANPDLVTSLAGYAETRQIEAEYIGNTIKPVVGSSMSPGAQSVLLLSISAAADYFTVNKTLMANVPPVLVDIILDPFIFNVFPRSLIPTAAYVAIIAIGSCFIAQFMSKWLGGLAKTDIQKKDI